MSTVTSTDGTQIAYSKTGAGPAVVFVDGALCHRAFGPSGGVAEQLSPHYTVYTYDRRGRGESGDTTPFTVEREIEDLAAVIREAGGTAHVIGVSSGGALALRATAAGIGVSKVAVYEAPYNTEEWQPARTSQYSTDLHQVLAEGRISDAPALFMALVGLPEEMIGGMRQSPSWQAFEAVAPTLAYDSAVLGFEKDGTVPTELLATITVPTLAIGGGASPETLQAPARVIAAAVPGGEHLTLPGQTHDVSAEALAPELVKFFG